jgi:branched-chain amino acid aminotransferase
MLNFNSQIIDTSQAIFSPENRNFRYGDGLFETIRVSNAKIPLFEFHKDRLLEGMAALKMIIPAFWEDDFLLNEAKSLVDTYAKQNVNLPHNYRIRLAVFRKNGGLYTPLTNEVEFCMEISPLQDENYMWNEKGLHCTIFKDITISHSSISAYKTSNALPYVMAALHKQETQKDDCLLLNTQGNICESISANIFAVTFDNQVLTPPLSEGCIAGVMRRFVIRAAAKKEIPLQEKNIAIADLPNFKGLFLTNSIQGIRWISSIYDENNDLLCVYEKPKLAQNLLNSINRYLSLQ